MFDIGAVRDDTGQKPLSRSHHALDWLEIRQNKCTFNTNR